MDITSLTKQAAEFGVTAFLLVLVLTGGGCAIWKVSNKAVDAFTELFRRQADAAEKMAVAVDKIGEMAVSIDVHANTTEKEVSVISGGIKNQTRAMRHIISALHLLTPEKDQRARDLLQDARRVLEDA